jgi:hypothetical protein
MRVLVSGADAATQHENMRLEVARARPWWVVVLDVGALRMAGRVLRNRLALSMGETNRMDWLRRILMGKWDGKERRREPTDRLILEVPKGGNFDEVLRLIAVSLKGGSNAEVLTAINNLSRKVDEFMSTQEERLRAVKTKLDAIQSGVDTIQQQLADLKANNPDLEDEIAAIEATAAAIDTDVNPVAPPTEPPAEPTPAE